MEIVEFTVLQKFFGHYSIHPTAKMIGYYHIRRALANSFDTQG